MYWRAVFVIALLGASSQCCAEEIDARIKKLQSVEAGVKDKIIDFDLALFEELAASPGRPYSLVFFCSAESKMDSPQLQLRALRKEFALTADAFKRSKESAGQVYFAQIRHENAKEVFLQLGIAGLPTIFVWDPSAKTVTKAGKKITLGESKRCGGNISKYPWPAEELVKCVEDKTSTKAAAVDRPSATKHPLFPVAAVSFLVVLAYAAWKVYNSPIVRITALWGIGACVVFWFSTSGGMYNIIRGMPMVSVGQNGKVMWWMQGRGGQLGMEGFIMGTSYMVFSGLISAMTYVVPRIKNESVRGGASFLLVILIGLTAYGIFLAYFAKTSLRMRSFFGL